MTDVRRVVAEQSELAGWIGVGLFCLGFAALIWTGPTMTFKSLGAALLFIIGAALRLEAREITD